MLKRRHWISEHGKEGMDSDSSLSSDFTSEASSEEGEESEEEGALQNYDIKEQKSDKQIQQASTDQAIVRIQKIVNQSGDVISKIRRPEGQFDPLETQNNGSHQDSKVLIQETIKKKPKKLQEADLQNGEVSDKKDNKGIKPKAHNVINIGDMTSSQVVEQAQQWVSKQESTQNLKFKGEIIRCSVCKGSTLLDIDGLKGHVNSKRHLKNLGNMNFNVDNDRCLPLKIGCEVDDNNFDAYTHTERLEQIQKLKNDQISKQNKLKKKSKRRKQSNKKRKVLKNQGDDVNLKQIKQT